LAAHQFPAVNNVSEYAPEEAVADEVPRNEIPEEEERRPGGRPPNETPLDRNPDIWLYRKRTIGLLRRYLRYSLETGRLPSVMGREFFRSRVTSYTVVTF